MGEHPLGKDGVGRVVNLLGIQDTLVGLTDHCDARNDLVGCVGGEVDAWARAIV